jgi:uncharacterized protein YjbI with pentapeptide repeats
VARNRRAKPVDWTAIADLHLPDLEPADAGQLSSGSKHDGLAFRDLERDELAAEHATFLECAFHGCAATEGRFPGARFSSTLLDEVRLTTLEATSSTWLDVVLRGSRVGVLVAPGATWTRVTAREGRLDYVNLRGASLTHVQFVDCQIGELDLGTARLTTVRFTGCTVQNLVLTGATLTDVDLRGADFDGLDGVAELSGATLTQTQLLRLAPTIAEHLGITIEPE